MEDVFNIFDNQDEPSLQGVLMILNHMRYIFCSDKKRTVYWIILLFSEFTTTTFFSITNKFI